jgi:hypothetical protein
MARSTIAQTLPGTEAWFVFYGFCCMILLGILPLIGFGLLINLGLGLFSNYNSIIKVAYFLLLNYCLGGFWVIFLKLKEYWEEAFVTHQQKQYLARPNQQLITFELIIPENYLYSPSTLVPFFFYMGNAFKSTNITKQTQFNYGRWFSDVAFDFVVHHGVVKSFVTVQTKKYNETVEMFKRFFPEVKMKVSIDPYRDYPKNWAQEHGVDNYKQLIGFNLGNYMSNIYPTHFDNDLKVTNLPMDMMIRALRDTFPGQKIILQQIFRFDPNNAVTLDPNSQAEFARYRQSLFNKYCPTNSRGFKDSDAFEALLPEPIREALDKVSQHIEVAFVCYSYKILGLCVDANQATIFSKKIESFLRLYSSSIGGFYASNYIDIKYLTSNDQEYSSSNNVHSNSKHVFDNYIFPTKFGPQLESFLVPFYQKYYYPRENRYRTKLNYSSIINRDYCGQWNGDWNITSGLSIPSFWQLPSMSTSQLPIENLRGKAHLDSYKNIYEKNNT